MGAPVTRECDGARGPPIGRWSYPGDQLSKPGHRRHRGDRLAWPPGPGPPEGADSDLRINGRPVIREQGIGIVIGEMFDRRGKPVLVAATEFAAADEVDDLAQRLALLVTIARTI